MAQHDTDEIPTREEIAHEALIYSLEDSQGVPDLFQCPTCTVWVIDGPCNC